MRKISSAIGFIQLESSTALKSTVALRKRSPVQFSANSRPRVSLQAEPIIDAAADDALVEFNGDVGNYRRSAYIGDSAICRA